MENFDFSKTKEKNNVETELKDVESIKDSESSWPSPYPWYVLYPFGI